MPLQQATEQAAASEPDGVVPKVQVCEAVVGGESFNQSLQVDGAKDALTALQPTC